MTRLAPELERLRAARPQAARNTRALVDDQEREALLAAITADQHHESPRPHADHRRRSLGRPAAKHTRARPGVLAGSTLGLAGMGTALALVLGAASTSPAFAVTPNRDGTVTVRIIRSAGIAGANARLSALHVRARVVQVACPTAPIQGAPGPTGALPQARIDPRKIPPGGTLTIAAWRADGNKIDLAPMRTVRAGTSGNAGNSGTSGNSGSGSGTCRQLPANGIPLEGTPPHRATRGNSGNSGNS